MSIFPIFWQDFWIILIKNPKIHLEGLRKNKDCARICVSLILENHALK